MFPLDQELFSSYSELLIYLILPILTYFLVYMANQLIKKPKVLYYPPAAKDVDLFGSMLSSNKASVNSISVPMSILYSYNRPNDEHDMDTLIVAMHKSSDKESKSEDHIYVNDNNSLQNYCTRNFPESFSDESNCKIVKLLLARTSSGDHRNRQFSFDHYVHDATWETAQVFLEHDVDLLDEENDGYTSLRYAVENGYTVILTMLIKAVDQDGKALQNLILYSTDSHMVTALHHAARKGDIEAMNILLEYPIDVNAKDDKGRTSLHYAIMNPPTEESNAEIILILLNNHADIDIQDKDSMTALHMAVKYRNLDIIRILVKYNANLNIQDVKGRTSLHIAAKTDNLEIVKTLLNNHVNVNIRDNDNTTAVARATGSVEVSKILIEHIIKLKAAELPVSDLNLDLLSFLSKISRGEWIKSHERVCRDEIERMKRERFANTHVSFYDFFMGSDDDNANLIKNENIKSALQLAELERKFPNYAYIWELRLAQAQKPKELLEESQDYSHSRIINNSAD